MTLKFDIINWKYESLNWYISISSIEITCNYLLINLEGIRWRSPLSKEQQSSKWLKMTSSIIISLKPNLFEMNWYNTCNAQLQSINILKLHNLHHDHYIAHALTNQSRHAFILLSQCKYVMRHFNTKINDETKRKKSEWYVHLLHHSSLITSNNNNNHKISITLLIDL